MSTTSPPPRDSAPKPSASYLIGRADRIVKMRLEEALKQSGLSLPEYTALTVVADRPGLSSARLARLSLVTPQAIHKVVRVLEEGGLIERSTRPEGGRALSATITPAGVALIERLSPLIAEAEDRALSALSDAERVELVRLLSMATHHRADND